MNKKLINNLKLVKGKTNKNYSYLILYSGFDSSASNTLLAKSSDPEIVPPNVFPVTVSRIMNAIVFTNPSTPVSTPILTVTTYLTINNNKERDYLNITKDS